MDVNTSASGGPYATPEAFVGLNAALESTPAVASLDSPCIQQTKSEIRTLAAEIAQLAHAALEIDEFFEGFLPRLCSAMGAKSAGVWRLSSLASELRLVAGHSLPSALFDAPNETDTSSPRSAELVSAGHATQAQVVDYAKPRLVLPSQSHERILRCVIAEGQPILVPPGSVKVEAERPHNPLSDALIIIPVRIQADVEFLLEVIQRPSGGPAAQRGYLRFVAQMADLMADYLRRQQLRELTVDRERLRRIEGWLTAIAGANHRQERQQLSADALRDLFAAERAVLLTSSRNWKVLAISGARSFDPRSEIVLAAEALQRQLISGGELFRKAEDNRPGSWVPLWLQATNRRNASASTTAARSNDMGAPSGVDLALQSEATGESPAVRRDDSSNGKRKPCVDAFCHGIACRQALVLPLDRNGGHWAILAYTEETSAAAHDIAEDGDNPSLRLARSIGGLLNDGSANSGIARWLAVTFLGRRWATSLVHIDLATASGQLIQPAQARRRLALQWLMRLALLGLFVAVACFPVSQQISATAILQPRNKQMYYAPAAAIVTQVMVDEGDAVLSGAPLLQLTSHELETQVESLQIELTKTRGDLDEKTSRLNRGDHLSPLERDQLEFNLRELDTTLRSLQLQLSDAQQRAQELSIAARADGTIATWDLRNRLLNHPVQAGQLLASSYDPQDQWRLLLSIPDYRAGLVAAALDDAENGAVTVRFTLASHPERVLEAFAVGMAPQVTVNGSPNSSAARVVKTEALIRDTAMLPLKKDGAIARASIDCGRVPLCWLIFRDAAWALSSRIRMLW